MSASKGAATGAHHRHHHGRKAAEKAAARNSVCVTVPMVGTVTLPPPEQLAFMAGISLLVALEVIDWPIGVTLAAGHALTARSHNKVVRAFGKALKEI